ncbi:vacuolar protein sorting-associated protein 33A-like [Amphibalanus amphitrite]|uniref:vacuolar protein sorting-associated protein 33A-like n=1 Tax=Amphibalanus amphitrite TaxID=1232801 RepID=UPI001C91BC2B|nr:vacuolar protein sorting-associated protein 33A-like [Amphibalanus amphitrite]XP_043221132.1 vacuolar protein sorting-associated protein 33A-like [Amphibalanus amphitrite]XP_043221133.1 vacuolar protein sorting-associated protein 33A-like [Amphibalanus amphitrite]
MTSALHLMHGRLRTNIFRDEARQKFVTLLDKTVGTKAIVWDERLTGPFGLVAEYSFLREHDVAKMFPLRAGRLPPSDVDTVVFLVRPEVGLMELVAENVQKEEEQGGRRKEFVLCFMPTGSGACERVLEERRVRGTFSQITCLEVRLLPLDADLLSMEYPLGFKEYALENDPSCLFEAAQALLEIQLKFGIIPSICGKGNAAKKVYDYLLNLRREHQDSEFPTVCEIDTLLLIDREVDLITPVATQLTYEGLIDEVFGIHNNTVKLPSEKFVKQDGGPIEMTNDRKQFLLSSAEELYADIRDKNFNAVGPALSRKAKQISAQYEERHSQSVSEMKNFVKNVLPTIKAAKESLGLHTSIAELIKERTDSESFLEALQTEQEMMNAIDTDRAHPHIEQLIAKKADLTRVLRLICLQSACNSGLKPRLMDQYRRDLLQTYGFQHALTLNNLERAGLLRTQGRTTYSALRRQLKLTVDDVNEQAPTDISYTFSGYAPLSVRLAQLLARPGWRSVSEALALLPGPTLMEEQPAPAAARNRRDTGPLGLSADDARLTLVVFLGGATFAEVAALRFLSSQEDAPTEYVIATTKMINGNSLISSLSEELVPVGGA